MSVKPILFNTEMVRAILDRRKSCTRRLVKFLSGENPKWTGYIKDGLMLYNGRNEPCIRTQPYQPGDILYVRETWNHYIYDNLSNRTHKEGYFYKASSDMKSELPDFVQFHWGEKWKPSIHMPKEAARIWLKVTDVRVERLWEISADGIRNEGLSSAAVHCGDMEIALKEWEKLWNSTIPKKDIDRYGWQANPYVWVIEFERCDKPESEG